MALTRLMGILNVTPDSFYKNSRFINHDLAIKRGIEIFHEGADIIDIGGESTRPGSDSISVDEELNRVIPVITNLIKEIPIPLSIDTRKPVVAKAALKAGASIINDVGGFRNPEMGRLAADYEVSVCVMHMQGEPKTMQSHSSYSEGVISHLINYFNHQAKLLLDYGVSKDKIIIDPGIGFGKTVADNLEIIHNLRRLKDIGYSLLLGVSRKSFMSKILNKPTDDMLAATLTINVLGILGGADIIRVHDIREHRDMINILGAFKK